MGETRDKCGEETMQSQHPQNANHNPQNPGRAGPGQRAGLKAKRDELSEYDKELEKILRSHQTVIKVVGTGGAGNNTITRLMEGGIKGVLTIAINTDAQDLLYTRAHKKLLIGRNITHGLGAGSDPKIGEDSAKESLEEIKALLTGSDMVFITCGLGGGTGTGSAPIIAEVARSCNALTICIVTFPFSEEGALRWQNAGEGLEKLKKYSDTVIVIQNDKLWEIVPEVPLVEAFQVADQILVNAVKGITELVTEKGLINLDFADIRTVMKNGGTALIGMGESDSSDRAVEAVEKALQNPLIDLDITGAQSALLNITGGPGMSIRDAKIAMQTLAKRLDPSARVIWGARIDPQLKDAIRVMIIATGFKTTGKTPTGQALPAQEKATQPEEEPSSVLPEAKEIPSPLLEPSQQETGAKGEAKKIFREIMEEESEADFKEYLDGLKVLRTNPSNLKAWKRVKKACGSLAGTADMFDFNHVGQFLSAVEEFVEAIIQREGQGSDRVVELLQRIPDRVRGMIAGKEKDLQWARESIEKFNKLKTFLQENPKVNALALNEKISDIWYGSAEASSGSPDDGKGKNNSVEVLDQPSALSEDQEENGDGKGTRFSSVKDAVRFVDDLLEGKSPEDAEDSS